MRRLSESERRALIARMADKMGPQERRRFLSAAAEYDSKITLMRGSILVAFVVAVVLMEVCR